MTRGQPSPTTKEIEMFRRMWAKGKTYPEICMATGWSQVTVYKYLKRLGLTKPRTEPDHHMTVERWAMALP